MARGRATTAKASSAKAGRGRGVTAAKNATTDTPVRSPYDGASQTRRTSTWRAPSTNPNSHLGSLTTLRDRSRAAARNDGNARSIIENLVSNIIGTGITPLSQSTDRTYKRQLADLWSDWTDVSDADGLLDFYGQQTQAVRGWMEAGDCFIRMRPRLAKDGLPVPMQLQVLEAEMCPHTYDTTLPNGNRVRAGIEFDLIGRRQAYYFYKSRPGQPDDYLSAELVRVPAEFVVHLYDPLRAGQLRGLPILTTALVRLYELDKFDDAVLLRQQLGNLFAGFVKTDADASDTDIDTLTGVERTYDTNEDKPFVQLAAGTMQQLDAGTEVQFADPPDPPTTYAEFFKQQLRSACNGSGVPYEVATNDLTGLNDRTMRVLLNNFRRRIQAWQHQQVVQMMCRPIFAAWLDRAFLAASLPIPVAYIENPTPYARVKWQPPAWPYLNPVQDVDAKKYAIRAGLTTRSAEVAEQGEDAELVDQQQAEDNQRADDLGLIYDSDPRKVSQAGLTQARAAGSAIPEDAGANA